MHVSLTFHSNDTQQIEECLSIIGALCEREGVGIREQKESLWLVPCVQGSILVEETKTGLVLSTQTRFAGPGYHAFVVHFFLDIIEEMETGHFEIQDDLHYDQSLDFDQLVAVFEDELVYLKGILLNQSHPIEGILYDQETYLPSIQPDLVATPFGYVSKRLFSKAQGSQLMDLWYVWNGWEKDANYFAKAAMLTWAKYGPNELAAMEDVCDFVEQANHLDEHVGLPLNLYYRCCEALNRSPHLHHTHDRHVNVEAYLDNSVYVLWKNLAVYVPGQSQISIQEDLLITGAHPETHWGYAIHLYEGEQELLGYGLRYEYQDESDQIVIDELKERSYRR